MIELSDQVRTAMEEKRPIVALESTIFSNLGLPSPANHDALTRCIGAIEAGGGVAAVTVVLDGVPRVGIDESEHERILGGATKTAERELPVAIAERWLVGATTVSASLFLAAAAGIKVFATGGIGGVHRGDDLDVSADIGALATHDVVTVCAGAKNFLDIARTVELLETRGVPVLGLGTETFPAFYARSSGVPVPRTIADPSEAAAIAAAQFGLGRSGGILVTVPIPEDSAIEANVIDAAIDVALTKAQADGVHGAAHTPYVLAEIASATNGATVPANLDLAENNARVAIEIAARLLER